MNDGPKQLSLITVFTKVHKIGDRLEVQIHN